MAREFLNQYARKYHRTFPPLSEREIAALKAYPWPGNVRELKNVMERSAILSSPDRIELNLPACGEARPGIPFADLPTMDELQRRYIQYILALTGGHIGGPGGAADMLGMKRTTLQARMRKLLF
jgi:DNA-binding NtrC family response regulator